MSSVTPTPIDTSRRRAMGTMAGLLGLGLSATALDALASSAVPSGAPLKAGSVFTLAQMQCAAALVALIIPATETPGAREAGAHQYLDHHLSVCADKDQQAAIKTLLDNLDVAGRDLSEKPFAAIPNARQLEIVASVQKSKEPFHESDLAAWRTVKTLTVFAYYTSEIGATRELEYLAIPGGYDGDMPFSEVGRAWSMQPFV